MMSRQTSIVLILAILYFPSLGQADQFRPSSYDECITDTMKGVASDVAARAIISSCRNQFPKKAATAVLQEEVTPGTSRSLTPEELGRLTATAFVFGGSYRITFRNGNEHLTITDITIVVGDKSNPDSLRRYSQSVRIAPLKSESAKYDVVYEDNTFDWSSGAESESTWSVAAATGID